jgi:predicted acetyltransferase
VPLTVAGLPKATSETGGERMAMLPDGLVMRPMTESEVPIFADRVERTFGGSRLSESEIINRRGVLEPPRTLVVFDDEELVATLAVHSLTMAVPGGEVGVGGVNHVAVRADYRRRGLMTSMMMAALRDITGRGEAVSALWPSEAGIYGRFGYGLASRHASLLIDGQPGAAGSPAPGEIRLIPDASAADTAPLASLYRSWHLTRPGSIVRSAERWRQRLMPRDDGRGGTTDVVCLLHRDLRRDKEQFDGYALYTARPQWSQGLLPEGTTVVLEVCAQTSRALTALWNHLLSVDMMARTVAPMIPVDDPGIWTLRDPRQWQAQVTDNVWIRLIDVPAALRARTYARDVDVVLDVRDDLLPDNTGRYRLSGGATGASCDPTTAPADLKVTAAQLGASYLGGTSLAGFALTDGLEEKRRGALHVAATALSAPLAPCCIDPF